MANQSNGKAVLTPKAREMAALMGQWERSGERMKDFAARHGIKLSTFSSWRQELRRRTAKPAARTEFVEIGGNGPVQFELSLPSGVRLRVPSGFDAAALERLLDVLGRC
jgi:transposase-like protein